MRVVFLSSAYCGYVHTYAHDPAWYVVTAGTAEAVAPAPRALSRATEAVRRRRGGALRARLAAWMGRKEQPPC